MSTHTIVSLAPLYVYKVKHSSLVWHSSLLATLVSLTHCMQIKYAYMCWGTNICLMFCTIVWERHRKRVVWLEETFEKDSFDAHIPTICYSLGALLEWNVVIFSTTLIQNHVAGMREDILFEVGFIVVVIWLVLNGYIYRFFLPLYFFEYYYTLSLENKVYIICKGTTL